MSNAKGTIPLNAPSTGPSMSFESASGKPHLFNDSSIQPPNVDIDMDYLPSELAQYCLAIIEERCQGHISLAQATLQLIDLLPNNDTSNEAYSSYLNQLTKIDHKPVLASSRGHNTNEAITTLGSQLVQDQGIAHRPVTSPTECIMPSTTKHAHNHLHGPSAGPTQDSYIDKSMYAWSKIPIASAVLYANITQTLLLKANYLVNV